ncbi:unnamed protein product [Alopecurus aequalis]
MGLSSALLWWEEWQLRILVLASVFIQYVLWFSMFLRRAPILRRLRVLVWIAYIAGDAVAIYALATLFNRRKQTCDRESNALEVLWAPVLLIHLGGQPGISAYSLQDNEMWKRHTITLVSQVSVALYVFCKWWSGEKTLLAAAILLFVVGILKFAQKPWALRTASFNSMQTSDALPLLPEPPRGEHMDYLEEYVQAAKKCANDKTVDSHYPFETNSDYMFVDMSVPYSYRIAQLTSFLKLEDKDAFNKLQKNLVRIFENMYTRIRSMDTFLGFVSLHLFPLLSLTSTVLFAKSHQDGHNEKDIMVTHILFSCTTLLEFFIFSMPWCSYMPCFGSVYDDDNSGWHGMVSQYNLLSFCVRKKKPTFLMKLATFNFLREFIDQRWYIQNIPLAFKIMVVVRQHAKHGWKNYICDAANLQEIQRARGHWAIRKHHQLGWSMKKPFDESVLIWHVATDLCLYHPKTSPEERQGEDTECSRVISNYMIYLLLIHPEMLMPGTRSGLFTLASNQIIENSKRPPDMIEEIFAQEILNMPMVPSEDNTISDARKLAKALMKLDNEERWAVIQDVWVEMLCYSANRCRGYLHAKSLGGGGEFLSIIWLLLSFMGMETLADRYQRSEPPQEEAAAEEEAASTSRSLAGAEGSEDNFMGMEILVDRHQRSEPPQVEAAAEE